ncbi:hypothetical protein BH09BAC1_BH09BAC1_22330 [soil metagenome]
MEEEEILDHEVPHIKPTSYWPYIILGGVAAAIIKIVFSMMAPQTSVMVQIILLILLSMIMMNTTLNFYYQKKKSAKDIRTAVIICFGIYAIMQLLARAILLALDRYPFEFFDTWMLDVLVSLGGGALLSVLVAILSRKAD